MFEVTVCHPVMPPMGTVWEGVCVCQEAHSPVPPKSTTAHLDLTQTALFANKNTPSPELDLHFFFFSACYRFPLCFLLPFPLSSPPHLIL